MQRRQFLAAALGIGGAALAGCGARGQPLLKVGSQKGGTKSLMLASGVLAGAPYAIQWSEFPAAQHLLEAVSAGAADLGAVGDAPFLFAFASGARIRAVQAARAAGGGASTALIVRADSPIRSAGDLRGKRVATGRGSVGHYLLLRLLERARLTPQDLEVVFLAPGDAKAAFSSGAIDAWSTWDPYVALARLRDQARVVADGRGLMSGYGFQVASRGAIAQKRAILEDFLRRLAQAQAWAGRNREAYAAVLSRETGLDLDVAAAMVATTRGEPVPIDVQVIAEQGEVLARFQAAGAVGAVPDIAAAFDTSFNGALAPAA